MVTYDQQGHGASEGVRAVRSVATERETWLSGLLCSDLIRSGAARSGIALETRPLGAGCARVLYVLRRPQP